MAIRPKSRAVGPDGDRGKTPNAEAENPGRTTDDGGGDGELRRGSSRFGRWSTARQLARKRTSQAERALGHSDKEYGRQTAGGQLLGGGFRRLDEDEGLGHDEERVAPAVLDGVARRLAGVRVVRAWTNPFTAGEKSRAVVA